MSWRHAEHIEAGTQAVYKLYRLYVIFIWRPLYSPLTFTQALHCILGQEQDAKMLLPASPWSTDPQIANLDGVTLFCLSRCHSSQELLSARGNPCAQHNKHPKTFRCRTHNLIHDAKSEPAAVDVKSESNLCCAHICNNLCAQLLAKQPLLAKVTDQSTK